MGVHSSGVGLFGVNVTRGLCLEQQLHNYNLNRAGWRCPPGFQARHPAPAPQASRACHDSSMAGNRSVARATKQMWEKLLYHSQIRYTYISKLQLEKLLELEVGVFLADRGYSVRNLRFKHRGMLLVMPWCTIQTYRHSQPPYQALAWSYG